MLNDKEDRIPPWSTPAFFFLAYGVGLLVKKRLNKH
jgi:hypothetical protein